MTEHDILQVVGVAIALAAAALLPLAAIKLATREPKIPPGRPITYSRDSWDDAQASDQELRAAGFIDPDEPTQTSHLMAKQQRFAYRSEGHDHYWCSGCSEECPFGPCCELR